MFPSDPVNSYLRDKSERPVLTPEGWVIKGRREHRVITDPLTWQSVFAFIWGLIALLAVYIGLPPLVVAIYSAVLLAQVLLMILLRKKLRNATGFLSHFQWKKSVLVAEHPFEEFGKTKTIINVLLNAGFVALLVYTVYLYLTTNTVPLIFQGFLSRIGP